MSSNDNPASTASDVLAKRLELSASDILLSDPLDATHLWLIRLERNAVAPRSVEVQPGRPWRVTTYVAEDVRDLLSTLAKNAAAVSALTPFLRAERSASSTLPLRLQPLLPSGRSTRVFFAAVDRLLAAASVLKSSSMPSATYPTKKQRRLLEVLVTRRITHGVAAARSLIDRLNDCHTTFQLTLLHLTLVDRFVEDVNGMAETHSGLAVLAHAREGVLFNLAGALYASQGMPLISEHEMLAHVDDIANQEFRSDLIRGLFPNAANADAHLEWQQSLVVEYRRRLRGNAALDLVLKQIGRLVPSNLAPPASRSLKMRSYVPQSRVTSAAQADLALRRYSTSREQLFAALPFIAGDDLTILSGSIANGFGHSRSDIDVLIATDELPQLGDSQMSAAVGQTECKCGATESGHLIYAEYLSSKLIQDVFAWLQARVDAIASLVDLDVDAFSARVEDLRAAREDPVCAIALRLVGGVVLREGKLDVQRQRQFAQGQLNVVLATTHLLECAHLFDASLNCTDSLVAELYSRQAHEQLFHAALAAAGEPVLMKRWLIESLLRRDPIEIFERLLTTLFATEGRVSQFDAGTVASTLHEVLKQKDMAPLADSIVAILSRCAKHERNPLRPSERPSAVTGELMQMTQPAPSPVTA